MAIVNALFICKIRTKVVNASNNDGERKMFTILENLSNSEIQAMIRFFQQKSNCSFYVKHVKKIFFLN